LCTQGKSRLDDWTLGPADSRRTQKLLSNGRRRIYPLSHRKLLPIGRFGRFWGFGLRKSASRIVTHDRLFYGGFKLKC